MSDCQAGAVVLYAVIGGLTMALLTVICFFLWQIQKLVDKVMSRSFAEYQSAQKPAPPKVQVMDGTPDDLRVLQEFQL